MTENIFLNKSRTGTSIYFFSNEYTGATNGFNTTYVTINALSQPIDFYTFSDNGLWHLDNRNVNIQLSSITSNFITGYTNLIKSNDVISLPERDKIIDKFLASPVSTPYINPTRYVFFKDHEIDDYHININVKRTFGTLNTLSVNNNLINSIPIQESSTGVVFGKLEAIQNIKDINNNNIRIPLSNVTIGIFNPSEEFPSTTSLDQNGDRIRLNIKEAASEREYFNTQSFIADRDNYLSSAARFTSIPDHYKYITKTNDNGEFVLHNIPVGSRSIVYEVDMLKQGLTKDEVALNRFRYPTDEDANVDDIPHFFFREFPINVVPSWGDFQTGYTEVNISVNLDLRKWATYFIAPMSSRGSKIEDLILSGVYKLYNVNIRDMSKDNFPTSKVKVVGIEDMLSRVDDQYLEWANELSSINNKIQFKTHDFHAFKLPANMYDPVGFKTDINGGQTNSKGVWLSGYQIKIDFGNPNVFRATGFNRLIESNSSITRNNFDLNKNNIDTNASNSNAQPQIGVFPYERRWDHLYPDKYKIPKRPNVLNVSKLYYGVGHPSEGQPISITDPKYIDGDLVGEVITDLNCGGYGVQFYSPSSTLITNRFSKRVTKDFLYKYEKGVSPYEVYSTNYSERTAVALGVSISRVENGETWQRVECGYGYFLKPDGWPSVINASWGDFINPSDTSPGSTLIDNFDGRDISLIMDSLTTISEGGLNIYRVVNPSPINLISPDRDVTPTSINLHFRQIYRQKGSANNLATRLRYYIDDNSGVSNSLFRFGHVTQNQQNFFFKDFTLNIKNMGDISIMFDGILYNPGDVITIQQNSNGPSYGFQKYTNVGPTGQQPNNIITLPGNSGFDFIDFKYTTAKYNIWFSNYDSGTGGAGASSTSSAQDFIGHITPLNTQVLNTSSAGVDWFLESEYKDVKTNENNNQSCTGSIFDGNNSHRNAKIMGVILGVNVNDSEMKLTRWVNVEDSYNCIDVNLTDIGRTTGHKII